MKIEFNAEVFFPNSFYEKWWADIERRKHMGTIGPMEKRLLQDYEFFDFSIMQAVTNDITLIK